MLKRTFLKKMMMIYGSSFFFSSGTTQASNLSVCRHLNDKSSLNVCTVKIDHIKRYRTNNVNKLVIYCTVQQIIDVNDYSIIVIFHEESHQDKIAGVSKGSFINVAGNYHTYNDQTIVLNPWLHSLNRTDKAFISNKLREKS